MEQPIQHPARGKHIDWAARTIRIEIFVVIVGCALLLAAVSVFLALSGGLNNEENLVDTSKYQAVVLNDGSASGARTYFGYISSINNNYLVLDSVYLPSSEQTTPSTGNFQLVEPGCQQLGTPYNRMVVNRDQVAFWENLQDRGTIVTAIQQYIQQNPNGPDCT